MTVVRLSRDYVCVQGAPVIHAVDTDIFRLTYFMRCMACGFCDDQCCSYGVDIDLGNVMRLAALGEEFSSRIAAPRGEWFTDTAVDDAEFPTGRHVRTQTRGGKCVFRAKGARGCTIHAYALEKGIDYHELKPIVSTLFPATFEHGVLVPSSEVVDGSLICTGAGPSVYEGARGELTYYFGAEFVAELDILAREAGEEDRSAATVR
ncbi:MAG TPA: hypothetical protein VII56_02055 [Rhizomicrobium sp.]